MGRGCKRMCWLSAMRGKCRTGMGEIAIHGRSESCFWVVLNTTTASVIPAVNDLPQPSTRNPDTGALSMVDCVPKDVRLECMDEAVYLYVASGENQMMRSSFLT